MATATAHGQMKFPNGSIVERVDYDDGTTSWTVTPGPAAEGGAMPAGYPDAFPGATVKPAP